MNLLTLRKVIYEKYTSNIVFNGERQNIFPVRSGIRKGWPLSSFLFNTVLEVLHSAINQEKVIKCPVRKGRRNGLYAQMI